MEKQIIIPYQEYLELILAAKQDDKTAELQEKYNDLERKYLEVQDREKILEKIASFTMFKNHFRGNGPIATIRDENINELVIQQALADGWKVSLQMSKAEKGEHNVMTFNLRRVEPNDFPRVKQNR